MRKRQNFFFKIAFFKKKKKNRSHEWLRGVNWTAVKEKTVTSPLAPWIPKKSAMPDTRNFDLYQLYEKSATPDSPHISPRIREEMFAGY